VGFSNALELALSKMKPENQQLVSPSFLQITNSAGDWHFSFGFVVSGESNWTSSTFVRVSNSSEQHVSVTGMPTSARRRPDSQEMMLVGRIGLACALEESLDLLRGSPSLARDQELVFSDQEFSVSVATEYFGKSAWCFIFYFPPYRLHSGIVVVVPERGRAKIAGLGL